MYKQLIIIFIALVSLKGYGQKVLTYEGAYRNGIPARATARYSYYIDKAGKKIKHGSFRYLVKEKTREYRLSHNFQGNYVNGFKDGEWEYNIKSKDYGLDNQGYAESSEIILKAFYKNGYPEGRWEYSAYVTKRKKIKSGDKTKWTAPEVVKDVKIVLNFKGGILVDSLKIVDNQGYKIDIVCDDSGLLNGEFLVMKGGKVVYDRFYKAGVFVSDIDYSTKQMLNVKPHYEYYIKTKDNPDRGYNIVEHSKFEDKNCIIAKYLKDNIFNRSYFFFNYIEGDKIILRDSRGRMIGVDFKGLKYRELKAVLSKDELAVVESITYYRMKIKDLLRNARLELKKFPGDKELKGRVEALKRIDTETGLYNCVAGVCKNAVVMRDVMQSARQKCGGLPLLKKQYNTKEELLAEVLKAAKSAYERADKLSKP